jgi:Adenylate cyclase associated (CAP) N terminal
MITHILLILYDSAPQLSSYSWATAMDDKTQVKIFESELTAFLHRLEAATSRLEDIAAATVEPPKANGQVPAPPPTGPLPPTPAVAVPQTPEPAKVLAPLLPQSVEEFDLFITGALKKFVNLSDEVGGPVAEQVGAKAGIKDNQADVELVIQCISGLCRAAEAYTHQH